MCIALALKPGAKPTKAILKECFLNNPDGVGFSYSDPIANKVEIFKGYMTFRHFYKDWQAIDHNTSRVIHFRVATSGGVTQEGCHPFRISNQLCLIHNGILTSRLTDDHRKLLNDYQKKSELSDTALFVRDLIQPLLSENPELLFTDSFSWMLQEAIGSFNKLIFLNSEGDFKIINEHKGEWVDDIWYSNDSWKVPRKKKTSTIYNNPNTGYSHTNGVATKYTPPFIPEKTNIIKLPDIGQNKEKEYPEHIDVSRVY